ncbi:AcrR family transcriptional regulator [Litorivivens lipolytica]|uniref:AcrR family transcriptional regulator n=1 Tax=Litorivivens lipolytica TaxID=1524264 RepID=A0A7W4Z741_9GAMM|nr:TetR/AcrR family transcriptional regulator [Litorivivens lipolytica]MBB3048872.1 AcrR family transcriptional regulator [Litorivivens lipolytica]
MSSPPPTKFLYASLPTKERLIIAAEKEIANAGIAGMMDVDIVEDAGATSPSALRYHFKNRNQLLIAVILYRYHALAKMTSWLTTGLQQTSPPSLADYIAVRIFAKAFIVERSMPAPYHAKMLRSLHEARIEFKDLAEEHRPWVIELCAQHEWLQQKVAEVIGMAKTHRRSRHALIFTHAGATRLEAELRGRAQKEPIDMLIPILDRQARECANAIAAGILREEFKPVSDEVFNAYQDAKAELNNIGWYIERG